MRKILAILLVTTSFGAYAQQSSPAQRLSLAEAQEYALSNNLTLRNTNLDLEKAKKKVWETAADGMPQISAGGTYQHQISTLPEIEFQPGVIITMGTKDAFASSATLNQLIFNGSYIVGLQAASAYRNFAALGVEKSIIEIRANVAQSYYVCLLASESSAILNQNLALLEKTVKEMRAIKDQGLLDRTSVDQLEVSYNLLSAQCNSARRQVKNTRDMLKYIIGMPMAMDLELTENLHDIITGVSSDYLSVSEYKQDDNVDIKLAAMDVSLSKLQLKLAQSTYLPTIGAQLGLTHNYNMPEFSFQTPTTTYLGVSLQIPIFTSGKTHAQVQQARMSLQQSKNRELLARQGLDLEFQQASDAFQLAWENFQVQQKNLTLATRVLDDMKKSLAVGMKSSTDLIQANNSYLEAVAGLITAELNLLNSKTRIDKLLN